MDFIVAPKVLVNYLWCLRVSIGAQLDQHLASHGRFVEVGLANQKMPEKHAHLSDEQWSVCWVSDFVGRKYLEHAHARPVEVEVADVVSIKLLGDVLHDLHSLNRNLFWLAQVIVVIESAVFHNWVSFLSDLVAKWTISLKLVFSIKLYLAWHQAMESNPSKNCLGQAVLVDNRRNSRQSVVMYVHIRIAFHSIFILAG